MRIALEEADAAAAHDDVPVGAILVDTSLGDTGGSVVARGHNRRELDGDPTAHAEVVAIREAARLRGHWRLDGLAMVVTLEPCPMCAGAISNARISRVIWGCADPKGGAMGSLFVIGRDPRLNHRVAVEGQVLAAECATRLRQFFAARR